MRTIRAALPALLLACPASAATDGSLQLMKYDTAAFPGALCMDGSPGALVLRRNSASTRWIIYLQGGGACTTVADCAKRPQNLSSTAGYTSGDQLADDFAGILSGDPAVNPDFYDANQVLVLYCSSDYWSGNANPGTAQPFFFHGRQNATAAIRTLLRAQVGLYAATDILLTGASAGGLGIVLTANDLVPLLPQTAHVLLETDAGFTDNFPGYDPSVPPAYEQQSGPWPERAIIAAGRQLWGGRGDAQCAAHLPGNWHCSDSAYVIANGYLPVPVFVSEVQQDIVQLAYLGVPKGDKSDAAQIFIAEFAASMNTTLATTPPNVGIFSPDLHMHTEINDDTKFTTSYTFGGTSLSLADAIGAWLANPSSPPRYIQTDE